jgi:light-regulated signal transduction histidine kinase (bacteriophytochrome)
VRRQNEILEQRVAERTAELEQSNQELEAFSFSVSHDLRAPLRHVMGFAGILQQEAGAELAPVHLRHLESITAAGQRMNELIDDLLAFSQIGRSELHKRRVDLGELLQTVRNDLHCETEGRDIEWVIHPLPVVQADHSLLRQAMVNLVSNALKFTTPYKKACIEIGSSSLDPDETVVFVRDNGVGFDPRYVGKLFGVFQRLHHGHQFEGTGIGLANVRQIIRRHGGRVWAEGKPGEGATFYFTLPRTKSDAA